MGAIWHGLNRQMSWQFLSSSLPHGVCSAWLGRWFPCASGECRSPASLTRLLLKGAAPLPALLCDKLLRKRGVRAKQWQVTVTELYKHVDN